MPKQWNEWSGWVGEEPPAFEPETNTAEWDRTHTNPSLEDVIQEGWKAFTQPNPILDHLQSPKSKQIEGDHYRKHAIQPIEYILKNNLGPCEANVVKYVTRWRDKGGVKDLRKAIHYLELLIEHSETHT